MTIYFQINSPTTNIILLLLSDTWPCRIKLVSINTWSEPSATLISYNIQRPKKKLQRKPK